MSADSQQQKTVIQNNCKTLIRGTARKTCSLLSLLSLSISLAALTSSPANAADGNTTESASSKNASAGQSTDSETVTTQATSATPKTAGLHSTTLTPITIEGASGATEPVFGYTAKISRSGTKTDTPLIRTPQDITVITADQIEAQNALTLGDVMRYVGGVISDTQGTTGSSYDEFMVRGFMPVQLLDGLKLDSYYSYAMPKTDPYLLERVEVVKGPSSVLYGEGTPGGVINYTSKRPSVQAQQEVFFGIGNANQLRGGFDVGGRLDASNGIRYRVVAVGEGRRQPQDHVRSASFSIAPSLAFQLSDKTDLVLLAKYRHDPRGGTYSTLPYEGTVKPLPGIGHIDRNFYDGDNEFQRFRRNEYQLGYELTHQFNDNAVFRNSTRYDRSRISYRALWAGGGLRPDGISLGRFAEAADQTREGLSTDTNLQLDFNTGAIDHQLLVGVDYHQMKLKKNDNSFFATPPPPISIANPNHNQSLPPGMVQQELETVTQHQTGLYLQDQLALGNWVFVGSGRYDYVSTRSRNDLNNDKRRDHATSFRAAALYAFDSGLSPYFSYSQSFEPPSSVGAVDFNLSRPTHGEQYEVGLKYQPPGRNIMLTASVFKIQQKNVVERLPDRTTRQVGKVSVKGLDLEAKASLPNGFDLSAAATFLDSRIRSSDTDNKGNRMAATPKVTTSLWLNYTQPDGPFKGLGGGVGVQYVGSQHATNDNYLTSVLSGQQISDKVPAYTLVDLGIHYDLANSFSSLKNWKLALNVHNLFDKKYVASCGGAQYCNYGYGREIMATLRYQWH